MEQEAPERNMKGHRGSTSRAPRLHRLQRERGQVAGLDGALGAHAPALPPPPHQRKIHFPPCAEGADLWYNTGVAVLPLREAFGGFVRLRGLARKRREGGVLQLPRYNDIIPGKNNTGGSSVAMEVI